MQKEKGELLEDVSLTTWDSTAPLCTTSIPLCFDLVRSEILLGQDFVPGDSWLDEEDADRDVEKDARREGEERLACLGGVRRQGHDERN